MLTLFPLLLFPFCLFAAALNDARSMLIPNELSVILLIGFGIAAAAAGLSWEQIGYAMLTALIVFAIGFVIFALGLIGAGDVKLLIAIAPWFGPTEFFPAFAAITIFGAILGVILFFGPNIVRKFPRLCVAIPPLAHFAAISNVNGKTPYPYGLAIMAGSLWCFPDSTLFKTIAGLPLS